MFGAGTEAEIVAAIVAQGLPALVDTIASLCGQRVVVLQTEPISEDPVRRMDAARDAAKVRFVHDSTPPDTEPKP